MWFLTVLTISLRERHITVIRPLGTIHIYLHQSNFAHFFLKKNISELECYLFLEYHIFSCPCSAIPSLVVGGCTTKRQKVMGRQKDKSHLL